ncbi:MAG: FeoB-associated Cys-rich membrane protein [Bacteroidota bacterium]|nr:FeoB-associated Cys-rich membrane protein [Bacteroidota bacterium]
MNTQTIIVAIIIVIALFFAIKKIIRKVKKPISCDSCTSSKCDGCPILDLKKEIENKEK